MSSVITDHRHVESIKGLAVAYSAYNAAMRRSLELQCDVSVLMQLYVWAEHLIRHQEALDIQLVEMHKLYRVSENAERRLQRAQREEFVNG